MDILIVYWSGTGNTEALAKHIADGVTAAGGTPVLKTLHEINPAEAAAYTHILLGCPAMGAEELEETEFEPFYTELEPQLPGKHVALFGSYGWGGGEWLQNWKTRAQQAGIPITATLAIPADETAAEECRALGARFAAL